jgi:hypothetical protein
MDSHQYCTDRRIQYLILVQHAIPEYNILSSAESRNRWCRDQYRVHVYAGASKLPCDFSSCNTEFVTCPIYNPRRSPYRVTLESSTSLCGITWAFGTGQERLRRRSNWTHGCLRVTHQATALHHPHIILMPGIIIFVVAHKSICEGTFTERLFDRVLSRLMHYTQRQFKFLWMVTQAAEDWDLICLLRRIEEIACDATDSTLQYTFSADVRTLNPCYAHIKCGAYKMSK